MAGRFPGSGGYGGASNMPAPDWRPRVPTDDAVRSTHVDAAVAKMSCAQLGYFVDTWTELLVRNTRPNRSSPLIHRGYYSRVQAVRTAAVRFLEGCPHGDGVVQIVNLGVGFDTLYFWLRASSGAWRDDIVYYEVDFPEVLSRKLSAITRRQSVWPLLDATCQEDLVGSELSSSGTRELRTPHCRFVSVDMRIMPELQAAVEGAGFRDDAPTLFLSECVLVYMQAMHGDSIIEWAGSAVPNAPSAMIMYEQCNPHDRFGKVMVENLMQRGCPLLSIQEYPTIDSQKERFLQRGWHRASAGDMNQVYAQYLDQADIDRVHRLELLDEFEEWRLIQGHYFLLCASRSPGPAPSPAPEAMELGEGEEAAASATAAAACPECGDSWIDSIIYPLC